MELFQIPRRSRIVREISTAGSAVKLLLNVDEVLYSRSAAALSEIGCHDCKNIVNDCETFN